MSLPLIAVMMTLYAPGVVEDRVQVPLTERKVVTFRLLGQSRARPALGDAELVRFRSPTNPFSGVTVIVEVS